MSIRVLIGTPIKKCTITLARDGNINDSQNLGMHFDRENQKTYPISTASKLHFILQRQN